MILLCKSKETPQYTFKNKAYISLAQKIWELLLREIKNTNSLDPFKEEIKLLTIDKCPCRLC